VVSHVASNETLSQLAEEVKGLSARIEQVAAQAAERTLGPELEAQLRAFTEQLRQQNEQNAFGQLQERIAALATRFDASDARLSHLDTIERELRGVVRQLSELRPGDAAPQATKPAPAVDALRRDISRTQDSVEAVHGTVENVVGRLAMIETEIRERSADETRKAAAQPAPAMPATPEPTRSTAKTPPSAARERTPIDPNLPPDHPIEPGSGAPRARIVGVGDRAAVPEPTRDGAKAAASTATNFIAAARRAAKSAASTQPASSADKAKAGTPKSLTQRMRSLLGGTAVILLLIGGYYYAASKIFDPLGTTAVLNTAAVNPLLASAAVEPDDEEEPAPAAPQTRPAEAVRAAETAPAMPGAAAPEATGTVARAAPAPATATLDLPDLPPDRGASARLPIPLREAAASGDATAAYDIAMRFFDGRGVPASFEEAARFLQQAAKAGLAPAQFRLGSLYEKGQGVKKNLDAARRLYLAAAERGNAKAMHNLAVLYAEGADGKPDYQAASTWFRKAAEHGVADSQYNLGILYARGVGVEQNLPESYKWFALAAAQGDKDSAAKRDELAARLAPDELNSARLAVKAFVAKPQPDEAITVKLPPEPPAQLPIPRPKKPAPAAAASKISPT
jgi:localization factor PodJL